MTSLAQVAIIQYLFQNNVQKVLKLVWKKEVIKTNKTILDLDNMKIINDHHHQTIHLKKILNSNIIINKILAQDNI